MTKLICRRTMKSTTSFLIYMQI